MAQDRLVIDAVLKLTFVMDAVIILTLVAEMELMDEFVIHMFAEETF